MSTDVRMPEEGRRRAVIATVRPQVEGGLYPVKRVVGDPVNVTADIFVDGHDQLSAVLRYRREGEVAWVDVPLEPTVNDCWQGSFTVSEMGRYRYTVMAWVDWFKTWRDAVEKKAAAGQDLSVEMQVGAELISAAAARAVDSDDAQRLSQWATTLATARDTAPCLRAVEDDLLGLLMDRWPDTSFSTTSPELVVAVERPRASHGAWYELFPRSCAPEPRHGTLRDAEARLAYVASMGFDVLYLPPIHPIGFTHRKGRNNMEEGGPGAPGSPWAIGAKEGGHTEIHPQLGTMEDFRALVRKARELEMEIAMDLAYQCSPDHPWVREHPEWFRHRPDGTIQYAENPPKKYQDIYPLDFETPHWQELWLELRRVVLHWIDQGVRIFRVDNPHTKPFTFWEWLISDIRGRYPGVIFLSEAFTRPKVMHRLAKLGFSQSYTYFTWRNTKHELIEYFSELGQPEVRDYFRPNLWPNTPDILNEYLQYGGRPAFITRLVLAATLGASYGIYGPAFELCERQALHPGSEEYLDSEKYEIRHWDLERPDSLRQLVTRINQIRRQNAGLQSDARLRFHHVDNEQLICFSKRTEDRSDAILVVVNLDPHHVQSGWVDLDMEELDIQPDIPYQVHELLTETRYLWRGPRNYVQLDPSSLPAHIFKVRRRLRRENDFEYYM